MANDYSSERGYPIHGCSSVMKLEYNGTVLRFTDGTGATHAYNATSGKRGRDFSHDAQQDHGRGVIPEGHYWIEPDQMWTANPIWKALSYTRFSWYTDGWGFHRFTIHPFPNTETHDRGGFFIHGGTHEGSAGCIHIIAGRMDDFIADLKSALGGDLPRCSILLDVSYPK